VAITGKSPFNDAWFTGLHRLFAGDYRAAAPAFREANRLMPDLPDVRRALAEAEDKIKNPPPRPFPWPVAAGAVGLLVLVVAGGLVVRRWRRSRNRISAAAVVRLFDSGTVPLILDVRPRFVFDTSPFRIPGAVHLSPDDLARGIPAIAVQADRPVVAYCTAKDERDSAGVARALRRLGYRHVRILGGGLGGWTNAGLPLESRPVAGDRAEAIDAPAPGG
jgi:rhodanese-related sulfurtransferase